MRMIRLRMTVSLKDAKNPKNHKDLNHSDYIFFVFLCALRVFVRTQFSYSMIPLLIKYSPVSTAPLAAPIFVL